VDEEVSLARLAFLIPGASLNLLLTHRLDLLSLFFRLKGCEQDVEIWQRVLSVRSLVLTPTQDKEMWIKFANLCRKQDRLGLAEKTLNSLLGPQEMGTAEGVRPSARSRRVSAFPPADSLVSRSRIATGPPSTPSRRLRLLQVHLGSGLEGGHAFVASLVYHQAHVGPRSLVARHGASRRRALGVQSASREMLP
jgi:hypothetical protein